MSAGDGDHETTPGGTGRLSGLREEVHGIDSEILSLIERRCRVCEEIGRIKLGSGMRIRDFRVEDEVLKRYTGFADSRGLPRDALSSVCRALMRCSVEMQSVLPREPALRIAVLDADLAGSNLFGLIGRSGHTVDVMSIRDVSCGLSSLESYDAVVSRIVDDGTLSMLDDRCREDAVVMGAVDCGTEVTDSMAALGSRRRFCLMGFREDVLRDPYDGTILLFDCGSEDAVAEAVRLFGGCGAAVETVPSEDPGEA